MIQTEKISMCYNVVLYNATNLPSKTGRTGGDIGKGAGPLLQNGTVKIRRNAEVGSSNPKRDGLVQ